MADKGSKAEQVRALREQRASGKSSRGGVDGHARRATSGSAAAPIEPSGTVARVQVKGEAGIESGPRETKLGRPRIGEVRDKPWKAAGMSRSTWYRRKAEAKPK